MKRTKFIFKESYQQALDLIDDAQTKAELMLAITDYGINGNTYQGENKIVQIAMALIMPQIDRENRRYEIKNDVAQSAPKDSKAPKDLKDFKDLNGLSNLSSFKTLLNEMTPRVWNRYQNLGQDEYDKIMSIYDRDRLFDLITYLDSRFSADRDRSRQSSVRPRFRLIENLAICNRETAA